MSLGDEPVKAWAMSRSLGMRLIECGSKAVKHEKAHIEVAAVAAVRRIAEIGK